MSKEKRAAEEVLRLMRWSRATVSKWLLGVVFVFTGYHHWGMMVSIDKSLFIQDPQYSMIAVALITPERIYTTVLGFLVLGFIVWVYTVLCNKINEHYEIKKVLVV